MNVLNVLLLLALVIYLLKPSKPLKGGDGCANASQCGWFEACDFRDSGVFGKDGKCINAGVGWACMLSLVDCS